MASAPINPIVSFVGITALSLTVENGVSHYVTKETQNLIDKCKEAWNASEDSK